MADFANEPLPAENALLDSDNLMLACWLAKLGQTGFTRLTLRGGGTDRVLAQAEKARQSHSFHEMERSFRFGFASRRDQHLCRGPLGCCVECSFRSYILAGASGPKHGHHEARCPCMHELLYRGYKSASKIFPPRGRLVQGGESVC